MKFVSVQKSARVADKRARGDDPLTSDLEGRRSANVSYARDRGEVRLYTTP